MQPRYGKNKTDLAIVVLLFVMALLPRAIGADFGYFLGDERVNDAARVLTGELVPGQHFYPPLFNYINALAFGVLYVFGLGTGMWESTGAFRAAYFTDPTPFFVTARYVTALSGAFLAPLFYVIARRVSLGRVRSFVVALFGVVFPLAVYLSHIAKGDVALATTTVACFWVLLGRLQTEHPRRWDIMLGLMFALTASFKVSGVFVLAPFAVGGLAILIKRESIGSALGSFLSAFAAFVLFWLVFNIGVILDFDRWLAYQQIQSEMSLARGDDVLTGPRTFVIGMFRQLIGLGPIMTVAVLISPLLWFGTRWTGQMGLGVRENLGERSVLWVFWIALVIGTSVVAYIVGERQPEQLFLPMIAGFLLLAALTLASLTRAAYRPVRIGAILFTVAALLFDVTTVWRPIKQTLATPMIHSIDDVLSENFLDRGIVTMSVTSLPQTREAQQWEYARWDRLAEKYDVVMPEVAPERIIETSAPGAVRYVALPLAFYGLEDLDADAETIEVQPHAWPLQPEEWVLSYWLEQDFTVFVIADLEFYIASRQSAVMADFFVELKDRCDVVTTIDPVKPLFLEFPITIFDCAPEAG